MNSKQLGKINSVYLGYGGYQDAQFGVWFDLSMKNSGVSDGRGVWAEWSDGCKWSIEDQRDQFATIVEYIRDLCKEAGVKKLEQLKGLPVELTFDSPGFSARLVSWRILTEVL